jgi:hypothetical protein
MEATFIPQSGYARLLLSRQPRELLLMRCGFRVGGATARARAFDTFWGLLRRRLPSARAAHLWVGSDVYNTLEDARSGRLRGSLVRAASKDLHLAVAPWLTAELGSIGIDAVTTLLSPQARVPDPVPPMPHRFSVLTYLPARRFEFYGGPTTLEVARRLPAIRFDVVANAGGAVEATPDNVRWHGWVSDMPERYAQCSVVLRIPRHDGFGRTIIEGMLNARHCVYTNELPHVRTVRGDDVGEIVEALDGFRRQHEAGTLAANTAGRAYIGETFQETALGRHLVERLEEAFQR